MFDNWLVRIVLSLFYFSEFSNILLSRINHIDYLYIRSTLALFIFDQYVKHLKARPQKQIRRDRW